MFGLSSGLRNEDKEIWWFAVVMGRTDEVYDGYDDFADDMVIWSKSRQQYALRRRRVKVSRSGRQNMCMNKRETGGKVNM